MLTEGGKVYAYDMRNQLIRYTENGQTTAYNYWLDGLRYSKTFADGSEERYLWDGNNLVYANPSMTENVTGGRKTIYGMGLLKTQQGAAKHYYQRNAHGDVVALLDSSNNVSRVYRYDAFGAPDYYYMSTDFNHFLYAGQYYDSESKSYYLRARSYLPRYGRFTAEDPARDGLNWYTYCANNPVNYVDLSGLYPTEIEAAEMAEAVYSSELENFSINDWDFFEKLDSESGVVIGVFRKEIGDGLYEYSLVNKGSSTAGDWLNNIQQPFGLSSDTKESITLSKQFVKDHSGAEITMIGHSKGGAEAVANAIANNMNCMVFNPATTALSAYGLSSSDYTANMTVYIVEGEILHSLFGPVSTAIDKLVYLPQQHSISHFKSWNLMDAINASIKNHSMSSVISALREKGYK